MKFLLREHRKWGWKKRIVITLGVIVTSGLFAVGGINIYVTVTTNDRVVSDVGGIRAEKLDWSVGTLGWNAFAYAPKAAGKESGIVQAESCAENPCIRRQF